MSHDSENFSKLGYLSLAIDSDDTPVQSTGNTELELPSLVSRTPCTNLAAKSGFFIEHYLLASMSTLNLIFKLGNPAHSAGFPNLKIKRYSL
jgi:hypothetical protein